MEKKKNGIELQNHASNNVRLIGGFRLWSIRRLLAMIAASAAIIVIISTACLAGNPVEKNSQPATSIVIKTNQPTPQPSNTKFDLTACSSLLVTTALLPATILLIYSLMTRGKIGTGWKAICLASVVATFMARIAISIFCEITSENSIQDWDS